MEFFGGVIRGEENCVCLSNYISYKRKSRSYAEVLFWQNFYCFQWAHRHYHFVINGRPLQREEQNGWSNLSSIKCQLNKVKILLSERVLSNRHTWELWKHNNHGPYFMEQIGKLNSTSRASRWHTESHYRAYLLQNVFGQHEKIHQFFMYFHNHPSNTLFLIDRESTIHPVLHGTKSEILPRDSAVTLNYCEFCMFGCWFLFFL